MTTYSLHTSCTTGSPRRTSLFAHVHGMLSVWRQREKLRSLDRHLLKDIGLSETDVAREVQRPIWDVPTHWLK